MSRKASDDIFIVVDSETEAGQALLQGSVLEYEITCSRDGIDAAMNQAMVDQGVPCELMYKLAHEIKQKYGSKHRNTTVKCEHCQYKLGIKRCSKCYNKATGTDVRYCGPECQLAAWPSHKAVCGGRKPSK